MQEASAELDISRHREFCLTLEVTTGLLLYSLVVTACSVVATPCEAVIAIMIRLVSVHMILADIRWRHVANWEIKGVVVRRPEANSSIAGYSSP